MQTLITLEACQIYAIHRLSTLIIRDILCHEGVPYSLELAAWVLFYQNSTQTVSSSLASKSKAHYGRFGVYKWNESGFRPPLCTYRLNWARRTSWGWWDDWDDTVLQTQDSKFEPWRSEAEHATSRSRRLPTILTFTRGWGRNIFVSFKPPRPGTEPRTLAWKAAVLTTTLGPPPWCLQTFLASCISYTYATNTLSLNQITFVIGWPYMTSPLVRRVSLIISMLIGAYT